jgi:hypothetical protein
MANNTFDKAIDLGLFDSTKTIRIKGRIGPADPTDIYKFTIKPTFGSRSSVETYSRGGTTGNITTSFFVRDRETQKISRAKLTKVTTTNLFGEVTEVQTFVNFPLSILRQTFYVKFDKPTSNLKFTSVLTPEDLTLEEF